MWMINISDVDDQHKWCWLSTSGFSIINIPYVDYQHILCVNKFRTDPEKNSKQLQDQSWSCLLFRIHPGIVYKLPKIVNNFRTDPEKKLQTTSGSLLKLFTVQDQSWACLFFRINPELVYFSGSILNLLIFRINPVVYKLLKL